MEVLRSRGLHPSPLSRGHDNGCESAGQGWGARIRTWDRGTKTRCLTTWLRPITDIQSGSSPQNGGRGGEATTALTVGAASGASALGYAASPTFSLAVPHKTAAAMAKPPRP